MLEIYPRFESEMREIRECFYLEGYKTIYEVMQKKHNEFMQINFSESLEILGYTKLEINAMQDNFFLKKAFEEGIEVYNSSDVLYIKFFQHK
ncbi:MAG TPA: hypothetical protein EYP22_01295 [Methanosarcinales archaeon]|nr:hypothetical protein [Methanosarcinales archaeon]